MGSNNDNDISDMNTTRRVQPFNLRKATNAQLSTTSPGKLFLRLATQDTERLDRFQKQEAERKRKEEVASKARKGSLDDDPLGVGKQMERERKGRGRAGGKVSSSAPGKSTGKAKHDNTALSMGQIFETCSVTYDTYMKACFYALNNGFNQIDAWRSFRSAVNTESSSSSWDESKGTYTVTSGELTTEEIASNRLSIKPFYSAMQYAATAYRANLEGAELLDPSSLPVVDHEIVDDFAATLLASLPDPIFSDPPEEASGKDEEQNATESKGSTPHHNLRRKGLNSESKKGKDQANQKKPVLREDITRTLDQYLKPTQKRFLSASILSLLELYQHGVRQLFISYMTDDVLTGEPPSWVDICNGQLQLKPEDAETCMCALRIAPDLVPHRMLKVIMLDLSPVSGRLLYPSFIELLWRCATATPLAKDQDRLGLSDRDLMQTLLSQTGLQDDMPMEIAGFGAMGGAARRREDALQTTTAADAKYHIPADPLSPRSRIARVEDDYGMATKSDQEQLYQSDSPHLDSSKIDAPDPEVRAELGLRSLLDSLNESLNKEEHGLRKVPGFGFPSATELPPRSIEASAAAHVWHPMPCVLREVSRAPQAPLEVENLMESALAYHNSSQYDLAINAYIAARTTWLEWIERTGSSGEPSNVEDGVDEDDLSAEEIERRKRLNKDIPVRATIFILCGIGSVHESAGNDEMALTCYLDAQRTALSQLSHDDADMAVTFSHLGSVSYHLGRFTTSVRCYRVAVSIRLHLLGREHPDTAASHSSLGAALCMTGPSAMVEAMYNFRLAVKMLKSQLGSTHPRTVVAMRNLERARARPSKFILKQAQAEDGSWVKARQGSQMPRTLELRDDESRMRPGGQMAAFSGAPAKKKKGKKGKGKKKKK